MKQSGKFLGVLMVSSFFLLPYATAAHATGSPPQARVAVIGAGLAGLAAGDTIVNGANGERGGWRVDLFEATNRVGGRVWSSQLCTKVNNVNKCQTIEFGGELIDSGHEAMLSYAERFGLVVEDRIGCEAPKGFEGLTLKCMHNPSGLDENGNPLPLLTQIYSVAMPGNNVTLYSAEQLQYDWHMPGAPKDARFYVRKDVNAAGYPTTFDNFNSDGAFFDAMTLTGYLQRLAAFGISEKFNQIINVAYVGEYGLEADEQSSLDTLFLLGYSPKTLSIFGESDERYHIAGGNEMIIKKLKTEILSEGNTINYNHRLLKIEKLNSGKYKLTFDHPMTPSDNSRDVYIYDRVVLAIPFSVMRNIDPVSNENFKNRYGWAVDITNAGFSSLKKTAIKEQFMGRNAKLIVQFKNRYWRTNGFDGDTYSTAYINGHETRYQNSWESTRAQSGIPGVLTNYISGDRVTNSPNSLSKLWWDPTTNNNNFSTPTKVDDFLEQLDDLIPGATLSANFANAVANPNLSSCNANTGENCNRYSNVAAINWLSNPYTRGSYAGYGPGQYTKFAGFEAAAEPCNASATTCLDPDYDAVNRNVHFAGEHTSYDFIGYMEGAAASGLRAGKEVRKALKLLNVPKDFQGN